MSGYGNRAISGLRWSLESASSFIFIPKLIYSYRHPNSNEPPWPLPDSIPTLPTADTDTHHYQAAYKYKPPKPPKVDWGAKVVLLDKNKRYGNQNFFYKKDVYSWWHSSGGDLPVRILSPSLFAWTSALGISAFPVNDADGASISKSSLERLPCYTPAMTTVIFYDDEGIAQSEPLYLFGYFVEADDRYYFYQLKPILYKNNEPYLDYGASESNFVTFICGFHIGLIDSSSDNPQEVEIVAFQTNPYLTVGDVDITVRVKNNSTGASFNTDLYPILGGPLILNGLNWPIRFSEDGSKFAALFHCAEGGNRITGYINEHLRLIEFSINHEEQKITRISSERMVFTVTSEGETTLENTSISKDESNQVNLSYDTRETAGTSPCTWTSGEQKQSFHRITENRTSTTQLRDKNDVTSHTGSYVMAVSYSENELIKANIEIEYSNTETATSEIFGNNGVYAEIWSRSGTSGTSLLGPWVTSGQQPRLFVYDGDLYPISGQNGCFGWSGTWVRYGGGSNGKVSQYLKRGSNSTRTDQSSKIYINNINIKLPIDSGEKELSLLSMSGTQETFYTKYEEDAIPHGSIPSYEDIYYNNLDGGYINYTGTRRNSGGQSFFEELDTDGVISRYTYTGTRKQYNSILERNEEFSLKQLGYLNLKDKIASFIKTEGEYNRIINSTRQIEDTSGSFTEEIRTLSGNQTITSDISIDINNPLGSGTRYSKQIVSVILLPYGQTDQEIVLGDPQEVEREDDFSSDQFIGSSLSLPPQEPYSTSSEYDVSPSSIFSFMDLASSIGVASRSHKDIIDSVYLASLFYQKINFYYGEQDWFYGSYFPPVNEFYSYQLKGIDTNVPPSSSLQSPVNPDDVDIGNQLCPIGFLKM